MAGRFQLLGLSGRGGMSTVWRAIQHGPGKFRRIVALKHMRRALADKQLFRAMFYEEARIGAVLHDPNIAQVYDFLVEGRDLLLILEWIEGIDLHTYLDYVTKYEERETRWELMVGLAIGVLRGMAAAHERCTETGAPEPIVHRDVTPHNVLIGEKGKVKLIDFGLSLASDREMDTTAPGMAKGKAAYLAPEVVRGGRATPQSDQFAAGAVLWEALAGRRLFDDPDREQVLRRIATADVEPLSSRRPDLPKELREIVHRALALDPADRFPSVREMANRLGKVLERVSSGHDLYKALAYEVYDARVALELGHRTQGDHFETPMPERSSAVIELGDDDLELVA